MPILSILDLVRVKAGCSRADALAESVALAQHAERLGYLRFWVAEHHNMPGIASAATSIVIGQIAAATKTIRVGAGGVMLPNHAPLIIAEQFGTLATMYPDRIDLGLGRAPGTDGLTLRALRRAPDASDRFGDDVLELQALLAPVGPGQRVEAVPGSGTEIPLWILGSSLFGAHLAAMLGLPYAFASHFAPAALLPALAAYREKFEPSRQSARPHAMVAVNIITAETDEEALHLAKSQRSYMAGVLTGDPALLAPPDENLVLSQHISTQIDQMLACSIVSGRQHLRHRLDALVQQTGADELIVVCDIYDPALRRRALEILSEVNSQERTDQ